jgi:hypothetical protein
VWTIWRWAGDPVVWLLVVLQDAFFDWVFQLYGLFLDVENWLCPRHAKEDVVLLADQSSRKGLVDIKKIIECFFVQKFAFSIFFSCVVGRLYDINNFFDRVSSYATDNTSPFSIFPSLPSPFFGYPLALWYFKTSRH